ncbi:UNVERIFIED_ORG: hypothetical protein GGE63_004289 [Rhizobium esperanzae]
MLRTGHLPLPPPSRFRAAARSVETIFGPAKFICMTKEEFCERFFQRIRLHCRSGRQPFGLDPKTYCDKIAPIYWRELGNELSPEECAD